MQEDRRKHLPSWGQTRNRFARQLSENIVMTTMRIFFLQGCAALSQIFQIFLFPFWHHKYRNFKRVYHAICYPSGC